MDIALGEEIALVRVSPGESIHAAVLDAFEQSGRRFTTVVSMIGSLQYVDWGIASCDTEGIPGPGARKQRREAIEIGGIQGHVGVDAEGGPSCHLHGVMFDAHGQCIGGHIFVGEVLITVEFALVGGANVLWNRFFASINGSGPLPLLGPASHLEIQS